MLILSAAFGVLLYIILRTQGVHPWNPRNLDSGTWDVSFNTTTSFLSNTNWQYYAGETTLSNFSQMAGLAVRNFISAGVGISGIGGAVPMAQMMSGEVIWGGVGSGLSSMLLGGTSDAAAPGPRDT